MNLYNSETPKLLESKPTPIMGGGGGGGGFEFEITIEAMFWQANHKINNRTHTERMEVYKTMKGDRNIELKKRE